MIESHKLLTIAIPTYNGGKTIESMLDILLPQIDDRVEVLISDNCSSDNTQIIVSKYLTKYPFIKYIRNKYNIGADRNFLQCMYAAKGMFTMLLSDDDILVENALEKILEFLEKNYFVSLVFLNTISFKDRYVDISHCNVFTEFSKYIEKDIVTTDKFVFMEYVGRQWGFTSSFLWNTNRFREIKNPEKFYGTFWLQSYIHILCSNRETDKLGIIAGPCVAAGGYGIIPNFDACDVEVISFKKMIDFASEIGGYNKKQLTDMWLWKICFVLKRRIIKERSIGICVTSSHKLFSCLKKYPYVWFHLFPYLLVPSFVCKIIVYFVRYWQKRPFNTCVNRE